MVWNPVPEDPFGGMPTVTGETWTVFTIQHRGRVGQGHPIFLTIPVKMGLGFGMYSPCSVFFFFKFGAKTESFSICG